MYEKQRPGTRFNEENLSIKKALSRISRACFLCLKKSISHLDVEEIEKYVYISLAFNTYTVLNIYQVVLLNGNTF